MLLHVSKWGNNLGIKISSAIAKQLGIFEGETVELLVEKQHLLIQKTYQLESLLKQITPDNLHTEIESGLLVGNDSLNANQG